MDFYDQQIEEIKRLHPLASNPRKNKIGETVVGYNHPARDKEAKGGDFENLLQTDYEFAVRLAKRLFKRFDEYKTPVKSVLIHVCFFLGEKRMKQTMESFIEAVNLGAWGKAALVLSNCRWYKNDPSTGKLLAERLVRQTYG
jgi:hypothetical protein